VRQLGRLDRTLHRHDRGPLDRVGVVVRPEGEAEGRAGALGRRRGRAVAEPGLVLAQAVTDVVALEGLGGLVRAQQPHALGGITVTLLAAVIPIGHVVFLSSGPPWVCSGVARVVGLIVCRASILHAQPRQVVARAAEGVERTRAGRRSRPWSSLEELLLLVVEGGADIALVLVRKLV
jgi:hypothetical protein